MEANKLSVGILVESVQVPAWAYHMVEQIIQGDYARVSLLVKATILEASSEECRTSAHTAVNESIYHWIGRLDRWLNPVDPDAFETKNLQELLSGVPSTDVKLVRQVEHDYMDDQNSDVIQEYDLDVLISLTSKDVRGKILILPQFGVWAYYHGDYRRTTGGHFGLREVLEGWEGTSASLILLSNDQRCEKILFDSISFTDSFSFIRNNNNNYWKAASFAPRKLQAIHRYGKEAFWQRVRQTNQHPIIFSFRDRGLPSQSEWLRFIINRIYKRLVHKVNRFFFYEQYILLFKIDKMKLLSNALADFSMFVPPYDRFWADPFLVHHEGLYYVFIEEVLGSRNKGHIAVFTIDRDGKCTQPKPVLEKPYHMSYPFIFQYNNEYYMMPESGENRSIDLYRCVEFPAKWEHTTTIMNNVHAYDSTLLYRDKKWWLFTCMKDSEGMSACDELFLFYTEDLFSGCWIPHKLNPIVSDVRSARPAGKIFEHHNGNLYRPSQNSAKRYGYGMKINHIKILTEDEYDEECVEDVEPLWHRNVLSVHTLNYLEHMTIIDAELKKPRFPAALVRKARKLIAKTYGGG